MKKIVLLLFIPFLLLASNLDEVKLALIKEYKNKFPNIIIEQIDLYNNSLPKDFNDYRFLRLSNAKFNKAQGFLRVEFKTPEQFSKNIFFKYFIKARLEIIKSNKDIKKGDLLDVSLYKITLLDFDKIPLNALSKDDNLNLIAKTNIKKNTILKKNMFRDNYLIKKNDIVIGVLNEGDLRMSVELTALENGNLNKKIRLKNKEGRTMQGIVVDKNKVEIQ
ncbi:flagellar basal body P-ring formation chaperone FlgA [Campylobacter sp. US33a]|uniref:flagellar basal body P-ring formation chaperone FlgA n=1 Tax=Campylobacter sp. US33a TaxID=2498120 RepID=UPI001068C328|nr:flagellar basal body P-ring formation chaperone FlgA [Campylobacter sp. US33a]TEY01602.1 flagellar basal body P-ring formation protein FlgA [Campylobacter sp. US33a]